MSADKLTLPMWNEQQGHQVAQTIWKHAKAHLSAGRRMVMELRPEKRSDPQNRLMWSCLTDLSEQVTWFGKKLTKEGWKDFITGHLDGQDLVPNMDGTGFISIQRGKATSKMTKAEMTAVIELAHAFGSDKAVVWSPTSLGIQESNPPLAQ
jgi:NinB protein